MTVDPLEFEVVGRLRVELLDAGHPAALLRGLEPSGEHDLPAADLERVKRR